jgi:hypothetical protein
MNYRYPIQDHPQNQELTSNRFLSTQALGKDRRGIDVAGRQQHLAIDAHTDYGTLRATR